MSDFGSRASREVSPCKCLRIPRQRVEKTSHIYYRHTGRVTSSGHAYQPPNSLAHASEGGIAATRTYILLFTYHRRHNTTIIFSALLAAVAETMKSLLAAEAGFLAARAAGSIGRLLCRARYGHRLASPARVEARKLEATPARA